MATFNQHTGAKLISKVSSKESTANWDSIFSKETGTIELVFDDVNIGRTFLLNGVECKKLDSNMYYVYSTGDKLHIEGSQIVEVRSRESSI